MPPRHPCSDVQSLPTRDHQRRTPARARRAHPPLASHATELAALLESRARPTNARDRVYYWKLITVDSSGIDHTPVAEGESRIFGEQFGPVRTSRAMAIMHIAMLDAANSIRGRSEDHSGNRHDSREASLDAAIAQSAHDTLVGLYPSQAFRFNTLLQDDLAAIRADDREKEAGIDYQVSQLPGRLGRVRSAGSRLRWADSSTPCTGERIRLLRRPIPIGEAASSDVMASCAPEPATRCGPVTRALFEMKRLEIVYSDRRGQAHGVRGRAAVHDARGRRERAHLGIWC